MRRKILATALAGGVVASGAWLAVPAGAVLLADGSCGATAPTPASSDFVAGTPVFTQSGSTSTSGTAGASGEYGYIYGSGSADGGTVQGYQPDSGINGKVTTDGSAPCVSQN